MTPDLVVVPVGKVRSPQERSRGHRLVLHTLLKLLALYICMLGVGVEAAHNDGVSFASWRNMKAFVESMVDRSPLSYLVYCVVDGICCRFSQCMT